MDFARLFAGLPTAYLVISPELVIVEANDAYLQLLGRNRRDLLGRPVFEVFPPEPGTLDEHGHNALELSFERALDTGRPDVLPLYKYDVLDPRSGVVVERYWSLISAPLLAADGRPELLLQRVEDVTDYVRERGREHSSDGWQQRAQLVEAELHQRMQQLRAAQDAQEATTAALLASEQRVQAVMETAVDGIITIDGGGRVQSANRAAETMFGYPADELIGRNIRLLMPEPYRAEHDGAMGRYRRTGEGRIIGSSREVAGLHRDGSVFPIELAVSEVGSDRQLFTGMVRDITDRKRLEAELIHQARHDPLTGLANRTLLLERLDLALARRRRREGLLAVIFVDLDGFKLVNDRHGHAAGDELLRLIAARTREGVRPEDLVARLGGDEFVVLCEDLPQAADALAIAGRIEEALGAGFLLRDQRMTVSASIGVSTDDGTGTAETLLQEADAAMYRAKQQGGGRYAWSTRVAPPPAQG
ncbi:MAG: diguanylate cyclase [Mycobacteriales bacterium]